MEPTKLISPMPKRVFHFAWFTSKDKPRIHHLRDLASFNVLLSCLLKNGFEYCDTILNAPRHRVKIEKSKFSFNTSDLVVVTNRPPISDDKHSDRRQMYRSNHWLEEYLLQTLKLKCFKVSARSHMMLQEGLSMKLLKNDENRANIEFFCNASKYNKQQHSIYKSLKPYGFYGRAPIVAHATKLSCAYCIFIKPSPSYPAFLVVFSVGGYEGLRAALFLKTKWDDLNLKFDGESRFIMWEFPSETIKSESLADYSIKNFRTLLDVNLDE